jgi:hypothetical protein
VRPPRRVCDWRYHLRMRRIRDRLPDIRLLTHLQRRQRLLIIRQRFWRRLILRRLLLIHRWVVPSIRGWRIVAIPGGRVVVDAPTEHHGQTYHYIAHRDRYYFSPPLGTRGLRRVGLEVSEHGFISRSRIVNAGHWTGFHCMALDDTGYDLKAQLLGLDQQNDLQPFSNYWLLMDGKSLETAVGHTKIHGRVRNASSDSRSRASPLPAGSRASHQAGGAGGERVAPTTPSRPSRPNCPAR